MVGFITKQSKHAASSHSLRFSVVIMMLLFVAIGRAQTDYLPDNIDSVGCVFIPEGNEWGMSQPIISDVVESMCSSVPMVGDIDDDGFQEIVLHTDSKVLIFNSDATLKRQFNMCQTRQEGQLGIAKVQIQPGVYKGVIVCFSTANHYVYAYDSEGVLLWQSNRAFTSYNGEMYVLPAISFADFNHDGWSEVMVGTEIFDAATGVFLGKTNANKGYSNRTWADNVCTYHAFIADLCGNENLEIAAGNAVYSVDIQSRTDASMNQILPVHTLPSSNMVMADASAIPFADGNTFVVDINLDGHLDVVVMNVHPNNRVVYVYVWDVENQSILCSKKIANARKFGMPQIGDLDNDGYPEICFITGTYIDHTPGDNETIYALKYNPQASNGELDILWTTFHEDRSGATSMTLFDFNQDGYAELVYRDQAQLRIINGSLHHHETDEILTDPYDIATYACGSGTAIEYPVVCDVDLDGAAEIIVASSCAGHHNGHLYIFKSSGQPWAPARPVWNQYLYNVTNINRDLTIPSHLFNNATSFTDPDNIVRRPFNNFLQQGTQLDQYGRPYFPGTPTELDLTASICSGGVYADGFFTISSDTLSVGENEFQRTIQHEDECDSIITLHLTLSEPSSSEITDTICRGQGYHQHGFHIPESSTLNGGELTESLVLHNQAGCDSIVTLRLTLLDGELHILPPTEDFCKSYSAQLAVATSLDRIRWSTGEETQEIVVTHPGTYSVEAISGHCTAADAITIAACDFDLFLPNAITPSKDEGTNDYFCLLEQTASQLEEFEIHIYNRWGGLVYHSTTPYFRWDGTENGKLFPNNIYSYVILCKPVGHTRFIRTGTIAVL